MKYPLLLEQFNKQYNFFETFDAIFTIGNKFKIASSVSKYDLPMKLDQNYLSTIKPNILLRSWMRSGKSNGDLAARNGKKKYCFYRLLKILMQLYNCF